MSKRKVALMAVFGSGGHTTEMMKMINGMDAEKYSPRTYVFASSDKMTPQKLKELQQQDFQVRIWKNYLVSTFYFILF